MNKKLFILVTALLAGVVFAQEASESVDGVLKELGNYQGVSEASPQPVVTEAPSSIVADEPIDVDAVVEESRDLYAGGEFAAAQRGFEQIVKLEPENVIAKWYLRKLYERDHRKVEVSGMKAVDGSWNNGLVLRSYSIAPEAAEKMGLAEVDTAMDVEFKFPEVDFPKGSSAVYQPNLETLFVRNTRDNLTVLEEIIEAMDVSKLASDVEQVEIEAKFVEVSEGTLEELGFDFRKASGDAIEFGLGSDVTIPAGQSLFGDALRGGPIGGDLPFSRPAALGAGTAAASGNWSAFRFEDTFNESPDTVTITHGTDVSAVISALDQSTGADVLSAPRIVTQSGEEAMIRVGQLHTFPETYEPSASGGNIVHVKYDDWEETLLGVELAVTPQVDADQITMELNPKITELQGWQTYDVAPEDSSYTWYQYRVGFKFNHDAIQARLPIFRVREIETEVTIADGATIGMGGLVNEKVEEFEDKVPVLGNLPVVGRLFRNEGERAVKRNLLMFVTAKKVEPTGRINTARSFE